ncbi:MAG: SRPBCC family protein [Alphaproteobacteria bacterium]|nr:SRPBCC family protein [Alphaproteobacteria bacterium]
MTAPLPDFNPALDLWFERVVPVPPARVWQAWTRPEQLVKWFTPAPWTTTEAEIDLRPGGIFRTVMRSPEGESHDNAGCYLEVVPEQRLVWTDGLLPGYRPAPKPFMTGFLLLAPEGAGTRYTAIARHADPTGKEQHEAMGFAHGWGAALDQLVAMVRAS